MTPGSAIVEISAAVLSRFRGLGRLHELGLGIFDGTALSETTYPYAVLRDWTELPENRLANIGRNVTVVLHIWSNYEGVRDVGAVANIAIGALEEQPLVTPTWHIAKVTLDNFVIINESNEVRHGVVRFRFLAQPK